MNHAELVARAARWLRVTRKHVPVLQEIGTAAYECPDVIGWRWGESSTLIECKVSLEDFRRDSKKIFRRCPNRGMGRERWYAFPRGFVEANRIRVGWVGDIPADIPDRWGVVEFDERRAFVLSKPAPFHDAERNVVNETRLLVSSLRRATEGWGRKVFGEIAPPMVDGDPGPTAARVIKDLRADNRRLRARLKVMEAKNPEKAPPKDSDEEIDKWLEENGHHFTR